MRDVFVAREIVVRQGWLSHTPAAFQCDVLDRCVLQEIKSGARLFADGVPTGDMYGLVAGQIGVWIAHGRRKPHLVHFLRPGSWFESLPAFTGQGLRVSLSASRGVKVLRLPQQAMREIAGLHPEAWRLFALVSAGYVKVATLGRGRPADPRPHQTLHRRAPAPRRMPGRHPVDLSADRCRPQPARSRHAVQSGPDHSGSNPAEVGRFRTPRGVLPPHPHSCAGRIEGHAGRMKSTGGAAVPQAIRYVTWLQRRSSPSPGSSAFLRGPLQAASRSHLALWRSPAKRSNILASSTCRADFTAFVGPTLVGAITAATASQCLGGALEDPRSWHLRRGKESAPTRGIAGSGILRDNALRWRQC